MSLFVNFELFVSTPPSVTRTPWRPSRRPRWSAQRGYPWPAAPRPHRPCTYQLFYQYEHWPAVPTQSPTRGAPRRYGPLPFTPTPVRCFQATDAASTPDSTSRESPTVCAAPTLPASTTLSRHPRKSVAPATLTPHQPILPRHSW
ncbi:hypothetical protein JAAARDRAFT_278042 [Jaapia argillacea MUCL 33604]|uniref:Uncharacterized protein n=1 Tax=Jaapia argillacea MUCL 33604 TaxID=933084 RepID=A0A067PF07_9AGAM|nr:hypothetical protein JAAARDRAFT_278042 [Jaapia argillacea MUCL 33604]